MSVDPLSSLPVVPDTALPADVRTGSDKDKQAYQAALGFERQLLTQLTQAMVSHTVARLQFWRDLGILFIKENGRWEDVDHAKIQNH